MALHSIRRCSLLLVLLVLLAIPDPALARSVAVPPSRQMIKIYLVAVGNGSVKPGTIGCGDTLVAVNRPIPRTSTPLTATLKLLLSMHSRYYGQSGLYNALYAARLSLTHVAVKNGTAEIRLTGRMNLRGICDIPRVEAQLRRTALQFRTVRNTAIFLNGVPLARALSQK